MMLVFVEHCHILMPEILAFHMPLFFFLSGYIFCYQEENGIDFKRLNLLIYIQKRFYRILLPYLCFAFISFCLALLLHYLFVYCHLGDIYMNLNLKAAIRDSLLCIPSPDYVGCIPLLWFFPCMFVADVFFVLIKRYINKNCIELTILGGVILSLSTKYIEFRLPFCIDTAFMGVSFILVGYIGKRWIDNMLLSAPIYKLFIYSLCILPIFLYCAYQNNCQFLMFANKYGNYWYAIIGAITGIVIFMIMIFVSMRSRFFPTTFFMFFNRNSLVLFPIHLMLLSFVNKFAELISLDRFLSNELIVSLFKLIVIVILVFIITPSINKYFPILCGNYLPKALKNNN